MMNILMPLDAFMLMTWAVCALILAQEDGSLTMWTRAPVLVIGAMAFAYSLWLMSEWMPGPSGFPWQRAVVDAAVAVWLVLRTAEVLIALRRNSGRLIATRPFGVNR